jgi:hypothetical protein
VACVKGTGVWGERRERMLQEIISKHAAGGAAGGIACCRRGGGWYAKEDSLPPPIPSPFNFACPSATKSKPF